MPQFNRPHITFYLWWWPRRGLYSRPKDWIVPSPMILMIHFQSHFGILSESRGNLMKDDITDDFWVTFEGHPYKRFLSRLSVLTRYWYSNSVRPSICACLSVRPSVRHVPVFYRNGLTHGHIVSSTHDSPIILVLWVSNICAKFRRWR